MAAPPQKQMQVQNPYTANPIQQQLPPYGNPAAVPVAQPVAQPPQQHVTGVPISGPPQQAYSMPGQQPVPGPYNPGYGVQQPGAPPPKPVEKKGWKDPKIWLGACALFTCLVTLGIILVVVGQEKKTDTPAQCHAYEMMRTGAAAECAGALRRVPSEQDCRTAANYLGIEKGDPFQSKPEWRSYRPIGCYVARTKSEVFWNPGAGDPVPSDSTRQIICQGEELSDKSRCSEERQELTTVGILGVVLLIIACCPCIAVACICGMVQDVCCSGGGGGGGGYGGGGGCGGGGGGGGCGGGGGG